MTKSVFSKIKTLFGSKKEEGEHKEIEEENKHAFAEHEDPREDEEASQGIEEDKTHILTESSNENLPKEPQTKLYEPEEEEKPVEEAPVVWNDGDVIAGLYKVKGSSAGAMGVVYFVDHLGWRSPLAVKTPLPELMAEETVMKRFIREAEVWVDLGLHPNIATCFYVRQIGGLPMIFIEYVGGGSLRDWISDGKVKEWKEILDFAIQFCRGMEYAQAKGVIHRDIKPANCLMTENGVLKITDFGLVKSLGVAELESSISEALQGSGVAGGSLTIAGRGLGTPEYMPPEQFEVAKEAGKEADFYSFGVMLFEMVTGIRPFVMPDDMHPSAREYFYKEAHLNEMPPEPVSIRKDCPKLLNDLILKCLEKDPERRRQNYASFDALCSELEALYQELVEEHYPREKVEDVSLLATNLNNKGVSIYDLGREEEALSAFPEALKIDPNHPEAVYNQAILLWKKGEITDLDVIERIKAVSTNLPGDWIPQYLLGLTHLARKDAEGALFALNEAIKIAPNEPEPKRALKHVLAEKNDYYCRIRTFKGHTSVVNSVAFSPDGRFALSGSQDSTLRLWDLKKGECLRTLKDPIVFFDSVAFSPDGRFALSGRKYQGEALRLWDLKKGECLRTLEGHKHGIDSIAFSPDGRFALSGSHNTLRLWNLKRGECLRILEGHKHGIDSIAFSPNGRFALSSSLFENSRLWDVKTGKHLHTLKGHNRDSTYSAVISPDGRFAVSCGDFTLRLWDLKTGECVNIRGSHKPPCQFCCYLTRWKICLIRKRGQNLASVGH